MTLEQVEYFVVSVEAGSFSAAAERLFVSHSSVSRGVAVLESELGVTLLNRGRRTLSCTEAGEVFFRRGRALLQQARALRDCVTEFRERQILRLYSVGIHAPRFFELCREYQLTHPAVELSLTQGDNFSAEERLRDGSVDIIVTFSYSLPADIGLEILVLERGSFCALVSPRHEFAERAYLTTDELMGRRDILGENPFRGDRERRRNGPLDVHSILLQIKTGSGITVLPEHAAEEFGHGCVRIPIQGMTTEYQLVMAWSRDNLSGVLAKAIDFFRERLV